MDCAVRNNNGIPRFAGSGFQTWKFRMESYLDRHELLDFIQKPVHRMVEFDEEDSLEDKQRKEKELSEKIKLDKRCKDFIVQGVADSHLEHARDKRSALDAWASLSATFEKRGMLNKVMMKRALSLSLIHI